MTAPPEPTREPAPPGVVASLAARLHIDAAVALSLSHRALQGLLGLAGIVILTRHISPQVQGYYYTFTSILGVAALVELALHVVIINTASHEWARLAQRPDRSFEGDPAAASRLIDLGRRTAAWYLTASLLVAAVVAPLGLWFFNTPHAPAGPEAAVIPPIEPIAWKAPWLALVVLTTFTFCLIPFNSILEGCNQLRAVFTFRLIQLPIVTGTLWFALVRGWNLWAQPAALLVSLFLELVFHAWLFRAFWRPFLHPAPGPRIDWGGEIWPNQWRLALGSIAGYFIFMLFTPVVFRYHGPAEAGRMGLTLSLVALIQAVGQAWAQTRAPRFGNLIARAEFDELEHSYRITLFTSTAAVVLASVALALIVWFIGVRSLPIADRVLPLLPTVVLLVNAVFAQISQCQSYYLRAHKREPLLPMTLTAGAAQGVLVWALGKTYGPLGAAVAACTVTLLLIFPWESMIVRHARRRWHGPPVQTGLR